MNYVTKNTIIEKAAKGIALEETVQFHLLEMSEHIITRAKQ